MYKKNLKFWVMSKDMAKSLVAAALMVAFTTPVAANTATGSRSASGAFSKQDDGIVMRTGADGSNNFGAMQGVKGLEDLIGKTEDEIKKAALEPDEGLSDADQNKVFSNTYKNTVLHLNKTFKKDKWNSFVLPVSLKRDQFRQAFGANARLAKLSGLTSSEIQFETVNMDAPVMTDNAEVLTAYTPYIIFPTKIHTDNTKASPAYKATLRYRNAPSETQDVVVKANHYDIPNVTFKTNSANENDLSNMNTDDKTWTMKKVFSVTGDGTMEAHGTFARTFGQDVTQNVTDEKAVDYGVYEFNDHKIIDGRDNLIGCYFFDQGNLYYSSKDRVRGLRGFSCWFKPVDSSEHTKLNLYIDGVANGTTGIDEVAFGDEEPTGKAAKGIYNMNGQLVSNGSDTTNLPAGMYIVNGKKCVVR